MNLTYQSIEKDSVQKKLSSHNRCTFFCKNIGNLDLIPKKIRYNLVMNYKFFAPHNSRMCNEHVGVSNYWPLVKQRQKVIPEKQILISDLMYKCFQELKTNKQVVFEGQARLFS